MEWLPSSKLNTLQYYYYYCLSVMSRYVIFPRTIKNYFTQNERIHL